MIVSSSLLMYVPGFYFYLDTGLPREIHTPTLYLMTRLSPRDLSLFADNHNLVAFWHFGHKWVLVEGIFATADKWPAEYGLLF